MTQEMSQFKYLYYTGINILPENTLKYHLNKVNYQSLVYVSCKNHIYVKKQYNF